MTTDISKNYGQNPEEKKKNNVISSLEDACRQICEKEHDYGEHDSALFEWDFMALIRNPGRTGDGEAAQ